MFTLCALGMIHDKILMQSLEFILIQMELLSLKNKFALDKPLRKIDFKKYSPNTIATINNEKVKFFNPFAKSRRIYLFTKLLFMSRFRSGRN